MMLLSKTFLGIFTATGAVKPWLMLLATVILYYAVSYMHNTYICSEWLLCIPHMYGIIAMRMYVPCMCTIHTKLCITMYVYSMYIQYVLAKFRATL